MPTTSSCRPLRLAFAWLCLFAGCLSPLGAEPRPQITWYVTDWPPLYLLKHGQAPASAAELGEGQVDRVLAEWISRMPEYEHRFEVFNSRRVWRDIAAGRPVCIASAFSSAERLGVAYFTPAILTAPLELVVRADRAEALLAGASTVSLRELLSRPDWHGRLELSRSYGARLDEVLAGLKPLPRNATSRTGQTSEQVAAGLFDFTLDYAHTVEYLRRNGRLRQPLVTLPLREAHDWHVGQAACTRNPWGLAAIQAIDRAIRQAAATHSYREAYLRWFPEPVRLRKQADVEAWLDARAREPARIE